MRREHIASPRSPPMRGLATDSGRRSGIQFYGGRSVQKGELEFKPMFNKKNIAKLLVFAMLLTMLPVSTVATGSDGSTNGNAVGAYVTVKDVYVLGGDANGVYLNSFDTTGYKFSRDTNSDATVTAKTDGKLTISFIAELKSDAGASGLKIKYGESELTAGSYTVTSDTTYKVTYDVTIDGSSNTSKSDFTENTSEQSFTLISVDKDGETLASETITLVIPLKKTVVDAAYAVKTDALTNGSITVSANGGDYKVENDVCKYIVGKTVTLTVTPEKGYELKENSLKVYKVGDDVTTVTLTPVQNKTNEYTFTMPAYEVIAWAEFVLADTTYTVTLEMNGGALDNSEKDWTKSADGKTYTYTVDVDTTVNLPTTATKVGHEFNGWFDNEELTGNAVTAYEVKADATFYAKWTEDTQEPEEYTVTFDANGGKFANGEDKVEVETKDQKVTLPTDPTLDGKVFVEWTTAKDVGTRFDENTEVTENMTVYAKWRDLADDEYKIAVDVKPAGAGTVTTDPSQAAKAGDTVKVTATPASEQYELKSLKWAYTIDKDTTYNIDMDTKEFTMPDGNVTVFAQFGRKASDDTRTVRTEVDPTDGGTITVTSGETLFVKGDTVEFTVKAASNYQLAADSVVYKIDDDTSADYGKEFTPRYNASNDVYSFTMPDANVVITAVFEKIPSDDKIVAVNMDISGEWFSGYALPEATTTTEGVKLTTVWTDKDGNVQNIAFDDVEVETEFTYTITVEAEEGYELGNYKCEFSGIDALTGTVTVKPRVKDYGWAPTPNAASGDLIVTGTSAKKFYIIEQERGTVGGTTASVYLIMQGGEKGELIIPCSGLARVKISEVETRYSSMSSGTPIIEDSTTAATLPKLPAREDEGDNTGNGEPSEVGYHWTAKPDGTSTNAAGGDLVLTGTSEDCFYIIEQERGTVGGTTASVYVIMQGVKGELLIPCSGLARVKISEVSTRNAAMSSGTAIIADSTTAATLQ